MSITSSVTNRNQKKYRIVFLGDQGVGKTSIIEKYTTGRFEQINNSTVGIDFNVKDLTYNGQQYRLQMWDTAGQERYRSLIPTYLKNAHYAVIVFDLTKSKTLQNVELWFKLFREHQDSPVMLVGNKSDLSAKNVSKADIDALLEKYHFNYIQVSAKSGKKIEELFNTVIDETSVHCKSQEQEFTTSKQITDGNRGKIRDAISEKQTPKVHKKLKKVQTKVTLSKDQPNIFSNCCKTN